MMASLSRDGVLDVRPSRDSMEPSRDDAILGASREWRHLETAYPASRDGHRPGDAISGRSCCHLEMVTILRRPRTASSRDRAPYHLEMPATSRWYIRHLEIVISRATSSRDGRAAISRCRPSWDAPGRHHLGMAPHHLEMAAPSRDGRAAISRRRPSRDASGWRHLGRTLSYLKMAAPSRDGRAAILRRCRPPPPSCDAGRKLHVAVAVVTHGGGYTWRAAQHKRSAVVECSSAPTAVAV